MPDTGDNKLSHDWGQLDDETIGQRELLEAITLKARRPAHTPQSHVHFLRRCFSTTKDSRRHRKDLMKLCLRCYFIHENTRYATKYFPSYWRLVTVTQAQYAIISHQ